MSVTNTASLPPELNLVTCMTEGIPGQEAQGQRELVHSDVLPTKVNGGDIQKLVKRGLILGDPVKGDKLFRQVTLPKGWKKVATGHSLWSNLVDENGEEVATIFYKAAFYDRDAFINVN